MMTAMTSLSTKLKLENLLIFDISWSKFMKHPPKFHDRTFNRKTGTVEVEEGGDFGVRFLQNIDARCEEYPTLTQGVDWSSPLAASPVPAPLSQFGGDF